MSDKLEVHLFNGISIRRGDEQVKNFASRKAEALFVYLVCDPREHEREKLAEMLWDARDPKAAGGNLRVLISSLRRAVPNHLSLPSFGPLSVQPGPNLWADVYEFSDCLSDIDLSVNLVRNYLHGRQTGPQLSDVEYENLRRALALYRGEFLYGLKLRDASGFDRWITTEREKYTHLAYYAADRLASHALANGDYQEGIEWANLLLKFDLLNEEGHRKMMVLRYVNGQRNAAIDQFDIIQGLLENELEVPPSPETFSLFEQIRTGDLALPSKGTRGRKSSTAVHDKPSGATSQGDVTEGGASYVAKADSPNRAMPTGRVPSLPAIPHNLSASLITLIGRDEEISHLTDRLYDPARRLITVAGPGGIGKTVLAEEAAWLAYGEAQHGRSFADGVYFIALESVPSHELLLFAIADALQIDLSSEQLDVDETGLTGLVQLLRDKELLLVFDNFEHLLDGRELVLQLLQQIPGLTILITSREYLGIRGEWRLALDGLAYSNPSIGDQRTGLQDVHQIPPDEQLPTLSPLPNTTNDEEEDFTSITDSADLGAHSLPPALRLFESIASQISTRFQIDRANYDSVSKICAMVDGMPLAIELAASLVNEASCAEIASGVAANKDVLEAIMWNVPERQRNLRAVFNHSWELLDNKCKEGLPLLGIFTGSFDLEAVEAITKLDQDFLDLMIAKSLLKILPDAQLDVSNEVIAEDAKSRLPIQSDLARYECHTALRQYIQELLAENSQRFGQMQMAHAQHYRQAFAHFPQLLASPRAALATNRVALEIPNFRAVWAWSIERCDYETLQAVLKIIAPYFQLRGFNREAEALFQTSVANIEVQSPKSIHCVCEILLELARCQQNLSKYNDCIATAQRIIELAGSLNSDSKVATDLAAKAHYHWGVTLTRQGDANRALKQIELARTLAGQAGTVDIQGHSAYQVAVIEWRLGRYPMAYKSADEAFEIYEELQYPRGKGNALTLCGIIQSLQGEFSASLASYQDALAIYQDIEDKYGQGFVTTNLGRLWAEQGNYEKAEECYAASLLLNQEVGNRYTISSIALSRGRDAVWSGNFEAAEAYLNEALADKRDLRDRHGEAEALVYHSLLAWEQDRFADALAHAEQAMTLAIELQDKSLQAYAYLNRGRAYSAMERNSEALAAYHAALDLHSMLGQKNLLLEPLIGVAAIEYAEGELHTAVDRAMVLCAHLQTSGTLSGTDDPVSLLYVASTILAEHAPEESDALLQQAIDLIDNRARTISDHKKQTLYRTNRKSHRVITDAIDG